MHFLKLTMYIIKDKLYKVTYPTYHETQRSLIGAQVRDSHERQVSKLKALHIEYKHCKEQNVR